MSTYAPLLLAVRCSDGVCSTPQHEQRCAENLCASVRITCPSWSSRLQMHAHACPVPQDYENGQLYGLEKFWAFHHYHGLPEDSGVEIDPKVRLRAAAVGWSGSGSVAACVRAGLCALRDLQFS